MIGRCDDRGFLCPHPPPLLVCGFHRLPAPNTTVSLEAATTYFVVAASSTDAGTASYRWSRTVSEEEDAGSKGTIGNGHHYAGMQSGS